MVRGMTFTLTLILNVVLDVAILGTLAFVMSRPAKLTPHADSTPSRTRRQRTASERSRPADERANAPLRPVLD
jgi:hypothetical protein